MSKAQARARIKSMLEEASRLDDPIHERSLREDAALLSDAHGISEREFLTIAHSVGTGYETDTPAPAAQVVRRMANL